MHDQGLHCRFAWLAAAAVAILAMPAVATTAIAPSTVERLTELSELAIEGRVLSIRSFEADSRIFTEIEVEVADVVKGAAASTVTLRMYGGTVDGRRTRIVGAPCLRPEEEVFLFLAPNGPDTFNVVNLAEGKFRIVRRPGLPAGVQRDLSGIAYLDPTMPEIPETLGRLKDAVRAAQGAPTSRLGSDR